MSTALSTVLRRSTQQSPSIHRLFHGSAATAAKKASSSANRGSRLAGRLRFYKQVGVIDVAAPWENDDTAAASETVESPISAGVDGTKSASGIHHGAQDIEDNQQLKDMLSPRIPGSTESINVETWYGITLDGRNLKTPMGLPLALPSKHLAFAIAAEWDAQKKYLQPAQMPFMTLACTALDQAAMHPKVYREQALSFLPTDTVRILTLNERANERASSRFDPIRFDPDGMA
jgi:ATP synthase F1 complex assembly factor 2